MPVGVPRKIEKTTTIKIVRKDPSIFWGNLTNSAHSDCCSEIPSMGRRTAPLSGGATIHTIWETNLAMEIHNVQIENHLQMDDFPASHV